MTHGHLTCILAMAAWPSCAIALGPQTETLWPAFRDETALRIVAESSLSIGDVQEKDYAKGDLDQDGDIDLVCVRKEPFNTPGRFRNVLFMNEGLAQGHAVNGVLVDRTAALASEASDGGQGMLDLTADRDVAVVDVDLDGWLDVVTSTTYGQGLPKTISHPRVYINKRSVNGVWQGLRYDEPRTPTMPVAPNFCGVGVGDVTQDGAPDLYFVDYNNTLEDRLWINNGQGAFIDQSVLRMSPTMLESDFGVHAVIADMNGDGLNDIVKDRGSTHTIPPLRVSISYNNPALPGFFNLFKVVYDGNPYHIQVGDLNGDGRLDLVVEDDVIDRHMLNIGNAADGSANFFTQNLSPISDSFGGNTSIVDINRDGHMDILIADVDVDCCGCTRQMRLWRNRGNVPNVTFHDESNSIPSAARTGTHDVAAVDLNGDHWLDLVIGTCTGMSVWIAQPAAFAFEPDGLPSMVSPGMRAAFDVQITAPPVAGVQEPVVEGTAILHASVDDRPFAQTPLQTMGDDSYVAMLPVVSCGSVIEYYISAELTAGGTFTSPPDAPQTTHRAAAGTGTEIVVADEFEAAAPGWSVINESPLAGGAWETAVPVGTFFGLSPAAPSQDATPGSGVRAFITQNGLPGGAAAMSDVDGGPTRLLSPTLKLAGQEALISYQAWFFSSHQGQAGADVLKVEVSNNGGASWTPVQTIEGTAGQWQPQEFLLSQFITPTDQVRMRFSTSDAITGAAVSTVEAGLDDFRVSRITCQPPLPGNINGDGLVNGIDLGILLSQWFGPGSADFNNDGVVNGIDLGILLAGWTL